MEGLVGFILAGIALAGSPGPSNLSLAAAGAAFGIRASLPYLAGIIAGMAAVIGIVASGVAGLMLSVPGAVPLATAGAAIYFGYLAFRIATAPPLGAGHETQRSPSALAGLLLSLVNPKGYAAMAALVSGFVLVRERLVVDLSLKAAVLIVVASAVSLVWLLAGAALSGLFRNPATSRPINIAFAVLLLASLVLPFLMGR